MKILVPVKQVATLDDDFELLDDGAGVDPDFVQTELNEWDSFSLEAALQLREQAGDDDDEVVVLTVGDEESEETLLGCLAMGADRALRVWSDECRDADALAVARVLAAAAQRESPDLVLCGVQSSDAVNGPPGWPWPATSSCPTWPSSRTWSMQPPSRRRLCDASWRAAWWRSCGCARRRC